MTERPAYLSSRRGDCDGCGRYRTLTLVNWRGMDTDQCWECRGVDPEDDELSTEEIQQLFAE